MGSNLPGQSLRKCGHASHVDSCGSHSAGMRYPSAAGRSLARVADSLAIFRSPSLSVNHATGDGSVTVDAAVAQEGPVAANLLQLMQVYFAEQNFFLIVRSFGEHAPEGIAEERPSPEFEAIAGRGIAANVASLKAGAIHHADINAIGDGVCPLDGAPGVMLRFAELGLLRGMPSNSGRVKKNAGSLQCSKPRAFGIPLIPADQRAEFSGGSVEGFEAKIAGSEIIFFVVKRIVGNVHLAINADERAIGIAAGIKDRDRVVIEPRRALLEERRDQHNFILQGGGGELLRPRARDRLREIEQSGVFALAEILRLEELGQTNNVGAFSCRLRHAIERLSQIVGGFGAARHLDQGAGELVSHLFSNLVYLTSFV